MDFTARGFCCVVLVDQSAQACQENLHRQQRHNTALLTLYIVVLRLPSLTSRSSVMLCLFGFLACRDDLKDRLLLS